MTARDIVYNIQCQTCAIAREITGATNVSSTTDFNRSMVVDPMFTFRALPAYRSDAAKVLRRAVACQVRLQRLQRKIDRLNAQLEG